jgi:endonuclease/exonuclease/phosphatase (EEP) superfamily protein YafD
MMMRQLCILFLSLMLASCAWQGNRFADVSPAEAVSGISTPDTGFCVGEIFTTPDKNSPELDSTNIRLLNWNTHKYADSRAHDDLLNFGSEADLILLQESIQDYTNMPSLDPQLHWEFAPGYVQAGVKTGVMTASSVAPIAACKLTNKEPWLRSPKATNITRYALSGTDETLLVVNVHLINFTFGVSDMRAQLDQALAFVELHSGPVIVSGDFNTWSDERSKVVTRALKRLNLEAVEFTDDQRTRIFGQPVDHLYVRDINAITATSHPVESSDHNPISVVLEIL